MQSRATLAIAIFFAVLVTGCTALDSNYGPCNTVIDSKILTWQYGEIQGEIQAREWVTTTFGERAREVKWHRAFPGFFLTWNVDNWEYHMSFSREEVSERVLVGWTHNAPTISKVHRCLGISEGYAASYHSAPDATYTSVDFVQPQKGMTTVVYIRGRKRIWEYADVLGISLDKPSPTLEEYNRQLVLANTVGYDVETFVAWSGSYRDIQYVDKTFK